jgi:hypothetical protein
MKMVETGVSGGPKREPLPVIFMVSIGGMFDSSLVTAARTHRI